MIHLRMSMADLGRTRFGHSPLVEVVESLYLLSAGPVPPLHRGWFDETRDRLRRLDTRLLAAVVPARGQLARFLFFPATETSTSIGQQLRLVADWPPERLLADLEDVWAGTELPPAARELVAMGAAGPPRLAEELHEYWTVAIEPHWRDIRAVLEDDVAYRAGRLTAHGLAALLSDLHPELTVHDTGLRIDKPRHVIEQDLGGAGLVLVPSVFAWPNLLVNGGVGGGKPSLTYASRGIGTLWGADSRSESGDDGLGALIGRSRAAILVSLALPKSTTELAVELGQSPSSVSQHLSVLRLGGLVVSWRAGRRVLYRRTTLAAALVTAGRSPSDILNLGA